MVSFTETAIVALIVALFFYFRSRNDKAPPGPRGLPFLGNLLSIGASPHYTYKKWAVQHGPIVQAKIGSTSALILDNAELIRDAFNDPVFSGRPDNKPFQIMSKGKHGILNSEGKIWTEQRRFVMRTLRDFGFGKKSMEALITDEVQDLLAWMKENEGKAVSVNKKFSITVVNALWVIIAGHRHDQNDTEQSSNFDEVNDIFGGELYNKVSLFFPTLTALAMKYPKLSGWQRVVDSAVPLTKLFEGAVVEHETDPADENNPRDFIDVYLNEIKNCQDPDSSFYKAAGRHSLIAVLGDLYGAGSGTTSVTLVFAILYLLTHPKVQAKLQEEIDRVTGSSRLPSLTDKPNTPYTEAVIHEILRFSAITPSGLFHSVMEDTKFHGYEVKKDTLVIGNLHSVLHDPETWGDPENFRPERFLDQNQKLVIRKEASLAFAAGKRVCPGETLARDQLYLFITSIFQRFEVLPDPQNPNPSLEPAPGLFREAQKFTVVFKDRQ